MYGKCNYVIFVKRLKSVTALAGISCTLSKITRPSQISLRILHIKFCCNKASLDVEHSLSTFHAAIKTEEQAY